MKLGCSSWSYHAAFRAGRIDLHAWLRVCAEELEVDGVELLDLHFPTTDPAYLRDLKKRCTDLGLTLAGVALSNDFGPDEARLRETQKVQQWCDIAAYLGAPVVRVFAGWLPPAPRPADQGRIIGALRRVFGQRPRDTRRVWSDVTWALRQCADYAAERAVVLALQDNGGDALVGSPAQLAQCLHDVGSPWLRACIDAARLAERGGDDAVLAQAVQVHARLGEVSDDGGDPRVHWPEVLRMLQLARYRGFVQLDYEGIEEPESAVPRAARRFRALMLLAQRQQLLQAPGAEPLDRSGVAGVTADAPSGVATPG